MANREFLDLDQISKATGLKLQLLRYLLAHQVLPGAQERSMGHRITRRFSLFEAYGIAVAGALLRAGMKRQIVAKCVEALVAPCPNAKTRADVLLERALFGLGPAWLELADGEWFRLTVKGIYRPMDTGWRPLAQSKALPANAEPLPTTVVRLDLARVREQLNSGSPS